MSTSLHTSRFRLGVCYYPEHWPETLWADDFHRMRDMGLDVIRIAEFAWSLFEPEEGRFTFDFFDRVMDLAHEHGLQVILGTPTATPPAWLTHRYPEVLNVSQTGIVYQHGQRRHYTYNAPIFQELCTRIADRMAAHYKDHPALLGWQIDNELNCEVAVFYAAADHIAFRDWLKARYGTLEQLNAAWGAIVWDQTYTDWEQVHLPRPTPSDSPNPHQALDQKRFISDSAIAFAALQSRAIRAHDTTHFVTTNGLFGHLDNHRLTEETLDFFSYDSYPHFSTVMKEDGEHPLFDRRWGYNLAIIRDISPQFCVMEQQSGPGGWVNRIEQPTPRPGQIRLWTYQSIAHGADMVLYFRWRTATVGTEIYWHGINEYHNQPNRRCLEVATVGQEVALLSPAVVGTRYQADIAIVKDYDNEWDGGLDTWHGPYERQSVAAWYRALQHRHVPVDVTYLRPETDLDALKRYRTLIYPHPTILTDTTADLLKAYVKQGGNIVFACRTGYKDAHGHCPMRPFPGAVADLCGATVEEFTRIGPYQAQPSLLWEEAGRSGAPLLSGPFNDILAPENSEVEVLATYDEDAAHYSGKPALVRKAWGKGNAFYFGGVFTPQTANALAEHLALTSPAGDLVTLPLEIELAIRAGETGERTVFLLNYTSDRQTVHLHREATDLLTGETISGERTIPAYDVLVLRG